MSDHDDDLSLAALAPTERIAWWARHPEQLLAALSDANTVIGDGAVEVLVERELPQSS